MTLRLEIDPVSVPTASEQQHLFVVPKFLELQRSQGLCVHRLVVVDDENDRATIAFVDRGDGRFVSPGKASYGGLLGRPLTAAEYHDAYSLVVEQLFARNCDRISVRLFPQAYEPAEHALQVNAMHRVGFRPTTIDLNYAIDTSCESLLDIASAAKRRKIRKCHRNGIIAKQVHDRHLQKQVYQVIQKNRASRGFPMTMEWQELHTVVEAFPNRFLFFATSTGNDDVLTAGAICIRTSPEILYVFYWGELPEFRVSSPVVALAAHLFDYAREQGYRLLDIGTATDNSTPNAGLINFKTQIGCQPSLKLTLELKK